MSLRAVRRVAAVRRASLDPVEPLTTWDNRGSVGTAIDTGADGGVEALTGPLGTAAPAFGELPHALPADAPAGAAIPQVSQ